MTQEFDRLTTRLQNIWRDAKQVISQRLHLREGSDRRDRLTRREEQRHQALHQEMVAADSSLTRAVEELQTAQLEFQALAEVTEKIESLQARIS
ncbi:hypothetical protein MA16_Dca026972 [Dendrobium catenatum]|uniref:Uncharacterized protein n=1 Tax=Dendrobium catenatum TaxID=906689 RepID=A0A2I0V6X1_9ASPA|nr:hypothetical protein MA16_Dca026972 [Dendrobium catenatum]